MVMRFFAMSKAPAVSTGYFSQATLKKEFKTKGMRKKSSLRMDVGWVRVSLPMASNKDHDTHTPCILHHN